MAKANTYKAKAEARYLLNSSIEIRKLAYDDGADPDMFVSQKWSRDFIADILDLGGIEGFDMLALVVEGCVQCSIQNEEFFGAM